MSLFSSNRSSSGLRSSSSGDGSTLTDKPGSGLTVPVIPVIRTKAKYISYFQVSEAVLCPPVIGFIPCPVIPLDIRPTVVPLPVPPVMAAMGTIAGGSHPPLVKHLWSWPIRCVPISLGDQLLQHVVLLSPCAFIQVHQPSFMIGADGNSVGLGNPLLQPTQQDALYGALDVTHMPAVRTVESILGPDPRECQEY